MPRNGNAQTRRTQFEKSFQTFTIGIKEKVNYTVSKDLANFANSVNDDAIAKL